MRHLFPLNEHYCYLSFNTSINWKIIENSSHLKKKSRNIIIWNTFILQIMTLDTIFALGLILFLCKCFSLLMYYTYHRRKWVKTVGKCFEIAKPFSLPLTSPQTTKYSQLHVMLGRNLKDLKTGKEKSEEKKQHSLTLEKLHIFMPCHVKPTLKILSAHFRWSPPQQMNRVCRIISLTKNLGLCECSSWFSVVCYKPLWYSRLDITHLN